MEQEKYLIRPGIKGVSFTHVLNFRKNTKKSRPNQIYFLYLRNITYTNNF